MELPNPYFPALIEFKIIYMFLLGMNCFPPYNLFPHRCNFASLSLLSLFRWTTRIHHTTSMKSSHPYSLSISNIRRKFYCDSYFFGKDSFDLYIFKIRRVSCYLSSLSSSSLPPSSLPLISHIYLTVEFCIG